MAFAAGATKAQQFPEKLHVAKSVLQHNIDNFLSIFPPQGSMAFVAGATKARQFPEKLPVQSMLFDNNDKTLSLAQH